MVQRIYHWRHTIYNPWSVLSCIVEEGELCSYWVNVSKDIFTSDSIRNGENNFIQQLKTLMIEGEMRSFLDPNFLFRHLRQGNQDAIVAMRLMVGYLKAVSQEPDGQVILQIPNKELKDQYQVILERWLFEGKSMTWYKGFLNHIREGNLAA